ncbi:MAG: hypothetical protein ACYC6O_01980 [Thermoleophilia bacterium]
MGDPKNKTNVKNLVLLSTAILLVTVFFVTVTSLGQSPAIQAAIASSEIAPPSEIAPLPVQSWEIEIKTITKYPPMMR